MGNCFQNKSFLAFCELKSLPSLHVKLVMKGRIESDKFTIGEILSHHCLFYSVNNSLGLTLVDTSWFTCMLGDDFEILFL